MTNKKETAQEVPVQEQLVTINLTVVKKFDFQRLINQLDNNHKLGHRR